MATANPKAANLNTIAGKVVLKESGVGIPNLLVVIYDLDSGITPEEDLSGTAAVTGISREVRNPFLGDRIGSVLTLHDGSFALSYDDNAFRVENEREKRPDLFLLVMAPEDADIEGAPTTLFKSRLLRQNSGRTESYFIRIATEQLEKAVIVVPSGEQVASGVKIQQYIVEKTAQIEFNNGIATYNKTIAEANIKEKETFKAQFKRSVANDVADFKGNGVFIKEGENVFDKTTEIFEVGLTNVNSQLGEDTKGVPVNLYLTPDDKERLKPYFDAAVDGFAEIPEVEIRPILFSATNSENIGTLLINNNPFAKYCREVTGEETCAKKHLAEPPAPVTPEDENITGNNVTAITANDIKIYMATLLQDMASPDKVQDPEALPSRPTKESIKASVDSFNLKKGPAETAAYYDFHSLQIAFEHVWQQLFDEDLINTGYQLHQKVYQQTGISSLNGGIFSVDHLKGLTMAIMNTPLADVPDNVAAHFDITKEEWNDLNSTLQKKLGDIAKELSNSLSMIINVGTLRVSFDAFTREKYFQRLLELGERLIDSVRHDDYYTMHKTLRDLHERLNANYEYTVFAADNNQYSVNFGILNTFRQEWLPLNYQVGKLCKTIPLSPKEERKYSLKTTRRLKRNEKEARKNNTSFTNEQNSTTRAEGEIMAKAQTKTNFSHSGEFSFTVGIYKGDAKHSFGVDAQKESQQSRKDFREAVLKATQEYKDEHSTEVVSEESSDLEYSDTGTIVNPNDELAVTYLFYELQRRYRISEQLYRVMPTVLVAQPVPKPHEITEAWVIAYDWILRRYLLDDSFIPSLEYLANKSVGDDFALRELRRNLRQQRNLVETLKTEFAAASREADNKYLALLSKIDARISEEASEGGEGFFTNVGAFFGYDDANPEVAKARELAASDEHKYATEKAEKMAASLRQEVDTLHKLTAEYNKTLRDHLDNETRTKRLLVHFRNHIIYYMQAIWSMEPPDQRFLRLQKVMVPDLQLDTTNGAGRTYKVAVETSEDVFAAFRPAGTKKHKATMSGKLKKPFTYKPLIEVADLDNPLGFKGNYMIFPMKEHNALTEFMAAPYIDSAFGAMDPDELNNLNLNDFSNFICCLHDKDPDKFTELKPILNDLLAKLLADPLRNGDEIIVPSGSLYIEALPADKALLEDFKLKHRELDVLKVQEEVRKAALENLRYAARLLNDEREDPDTEKKIIVQGSGLSPVIDVDN